VPGPNTPSAAHYQQHRVPEEGVRIFSLEMLLSSAERDDDLGKQPYGKCSVEIFDESEIYYNWDRFKKFDSDRNSSSDGIAFGEKAWRSRYD
jgi:hypothetical protein